MNKFVSIYEIDIEKANVLLNGLFFDNPDEAWLDFVYLNRSGKYTGEQYEIILVR